VQVCFVKVPHPQAAQDSGSYSFNAKKNILPEMYCFCQYQWNETKQGRTL